MVIVIRYEFNDVFYLNVFDHEKINININMYLYIYVVPLSLTQK